MDKGAMVAAGQALLGILDKSGIESRAAVWIHSTDIDAWKLWIVAQDKFADKREFYRKVAEAIRENGALLDEIDPSDTDLVLATNPVIADLKRFARVEGGGSLEIGSSRIGNIYVDHAIILRMAF